MRPTLILAGVALAALPLTTSWADAGAAAPPDTAALLQRLEEQEQRIRVLERRLELADETAAAVAKSTPVVKSAASGFALSSADSSFTVKLRGNLAVDGRYFLDDNTASTADTWLLRRVRPYVEGTVGGIYDFRFMPDFGGGKSVVMDAYVAARFRPWLVVQAGKFKGPVGLERLQPDQYNRFLELGFPSSLVPNRDLGVQLSGALLGNRLSYAVGYFDGTVDGSSTDSNATSDTDNDGKRDWEARLFAQPFLNSDHFALRGLGFGIGGSYVNSTGIATSTATNVTNGTATGVLATVTTASLLPTYRTPGQQSLFSYRGDAAGTGTLNEATVAAGIRRRITPQLYYYYGPFGLLSEYAQVSQQVQRQVDATTLRRATLEHDAWQVSASWFLTGEEAAYSSFTPRSTFQIGKPGWGAWELVARYEQIDFDDAAFDGGSASFANPATAVSDASALGLGVNWYLNQNFKWQLNYAVSRFGGGAAGGADRPDERVLATRFALVF
jgi:phosphate-selective porin OprO/OprP